MIYHAPVVSEKIEKSLVGFTKNYGRAQRGFLASSFDKLPDSLRASAETHWLKDQKEEGQRVANLNLLKITQKISPAGLAMSSDDSAICAKADEFEKNMEKARQFMIKLPMGEQYKKLGQIVARAGIESPEIKAGVTPTGAVNRMCAAKWWRAQLRATHKRWIESASIAFGSVRRGCSLYVSEDCLSSRKGQRKRNASALAALVAECVETGEQVALSEAVESSVSNPKNRRNEMMLRMHGMQEWARERGHKCTFLTVTCPSRMHAASTKRGQYTVFDNKKYDGTTPREAQGYLSNVWAKTRAELNRQGVTVYGVRVAEPHHDGTPHWHLMMFASADDLAIAISVYQGYALEADYGEWGKSTAVRFKAKSINWKVDAAGKVVESPVSYVAKYIAKNLESEDLDGLQNERSHEDEKTKLNDAIARVDAWRSCWGIRQFQFFGSHAVTIWRELRRIKEQPEAIELVPVWQAVHKTEESKADWQAFMEEMNALESTHTRLEDNLTVRQGLRLATEPAEHANGYGELKTENIIGLVLTDSGVFEQTRFKRWVIKQGEAVAPWSPSNNCTEVSKKISGGMPPDLKRRGESE